MKRITLLFLSIIIAISGITQTTYYIDATLGHDSNDGITPATAWKTIDKVNMQLLLAGDSVLFKRDEIWAGTRLYIENIAGNENKNIVYGAYGAGAKPILSSVITHAHSWINTTGNIWKAINPPSDNPERMLINGIEKLRANIPSELDGITYFWLYDDLNDLYIYADTDPGNFTFEYSTDFPIIIGWSNNITIRDLNIQGGWTGIFINTLSKNIHIDSLSIGKYCREGIIVSSGSNNSQDYPENIIIENSNFDSYFNFDYSSAGSYSESSDRGSSDGFRASALTTGEIRNCTFKNWGHASISLASSNVSYVSVYNNLLTSPDICYGGRLNVDDASYNDIYNNQIINTSVQSQLNGQYNLYHHNIFNGTTNTPLNPTIIDAGIELQGYANSDIIGNVYENNLFINVEGPAFRISGNNGNEIYDNIIRNNIIYECGTITNSESLVVEQDLFQESYGNYFQNNLIFNSTTSQTCNFRGIVYDVDSFNLQSGTDGYIINNNIANDPLFIDFENANYQLQAGSSCIDAGTATLATVDFAGNAIPYPGTNPDIGIFEYQQTLNIESCYTGNDIVVYPVPSSKYITISGNNNNVKDINMLNINGGVVLKDITINKATDVSTLTNGIYFITLKTANSLIIRKVIILK